MRSYLRSCDGSWYSQKSAGAIAPVPVRSPVAQLAEQVAVNHRVAGSSPARGAADAKVAGGSPVEMADKLIGKEKIAPAEETGDGRRGEMLPRGAKASRARFQREAVALRENLRRRKQQVRQVLAVDCDRTTEN